MSARLSPSRRGLDNNVERQTDAPKRDISMNPEHLLVTVPEALRTHAEEVGCAAVGFSSRPESQAPPAAAKGAGWSMRFSGAIDWLASFAGVLRQAHIVLTDGTVLYFSSQGFVSASPA